jgi:hypothetical protein
MSARVHHLKSRRAWLGAVAAIAVLAVGGFATTQAWAQSTTTTTPAAPSPAASADQLTVAKNRVDLKVDRRVAAIDRVSARVAANANLSAAQRTTLTTSLGTLKSGLVALKAKVDGETTSQAIKADVKAAGEAAKANPSVEVATLYARADAASAYLDAVTARVATIKSKLKAPAAANTVLSDVQAKVADARNYLNGFDAALLEPAPASAAQVTAATAALKAVGTDVSAIRKDVKNLRQGRRTAKTTPAG